MLDYSHNLAALMQHTMQLYCLLGYGTIFIEHRSAEQIFIQSLQCLCQSAQVSLVHI